MEADILHFFLFSSSFLLFLLYKMQTTLFSMIKDAIEQINTKLQCGIYFFQTSFYYAYNIQQYLRDIWVLAVPCKLVWGGYILLSVNLLGSLQGSHWIFCTCFKDGTSYPMEDGFAGQCTIVEVHIRDIWDRVGVRWRDKWGFWIWLER